MALAESQTLGKAYVWYALKGFSLWTFTLTVCLLVVGFPIVVLMAAAGVLLAVALQAILPVSAVLLVAGGLIGANCLAVLLAAAVLTLKGVHPQDVSWLNWLHASKADVAYGPVYASCPLTCSIHPAQLSV